ncbi:hypothetical protein P4604_20955 [Lysinibacillus capsici]|uniref:hypothetical protein n=1 Tax=Lysinibacillus capsici TaxID=2115968 RepID=UPI002E1BD569|nr:hypothetical protein [Lysinibacillus capsici]
MSIDFFSKEDFESHSYDLKSEKNIYLELLNSYPMTAHTLRKLGSWSNKGISFSKIVVDKDFERKIINFSKGNSKIVKEDGVYVESGMESSFNKGLLETLEMIAQNNLPMMFNDSFKGLTRNIVKLFKIIEYILDINGVYLTNNFFISNGYVTKRKELLKPMHTNKDMLRNLNNINGLNKTHLEYIKLVQKQILNN